MTQDKITEIRVEMIKLEPCAHCGGYADMKGVRFDIRG